MFYLSLLFLYYNYNHQVLILVLHHTTSYILNFSLKVMPIPPITLSKNIFTNTLDFIPGTLRHFLSSTDILKNLTEPLSFLWIKFCESFPLTSNKIQPHYYDLVAVFDLGSPYLFKYKCSPFPSLTTLMPNGFLSFSKTCCRVGGMDL